MSNHSRSGLRLIVFIALGTSFALGSSRLHAQARPAAIVPESGSVFDVDGRIALHSLMSLSDAHLQKIADVLAVVATTAAARSADWRRIRPHLADAARVNVPAVFWFAEPNGKYWTLDQGRATATLSDRAYFPRLRTGETVLGDLVTSHSTNRNTAIVAVPIRGQNGSIVGMLGSSVHLDSLAARIRSEMGGLQDGLIFFAIDATPLGALNSDPSLIFTDPMKLGDEGMRRAFTEMLSREEGVVTYDFRNARRTVLFRKSAISGWWYAFGVLGK